MNLRMGDGKCGETEKTKQYLLAPFRVLKPLPCAAIAGFLLGVSALIFGPLHRLADKAEKEPPWLLFCLGGYGLSIVAIASLPWISQEVRSRVIRKHAEFHWIKPWLVMGIVSGTAAFLMGSIVGVAKLLHLPEDSTDKILGGAAPFVAILGLIVTLFVFRRRSPQSD